MKKTHYHKLYLIYSLTFFIFFIGTISCRKDISFHSKTENFFKHKERLDPKTQAVYDKLRLQNEKDHFVEKLPENSGYPIWEKVLIMDSQKSRNFLGNSAEVIIPMSNNLSQYLTSVLDLKPDDQEGYIIIDFTKEYLFEICHKLFQTENDIFMAEQVLGLFLLMDKYVFGTEIFKNIPLEIFSNSQQINVSNGTKDFEIVSYNVDYITFSYIKAQHTPINWNWVIWLAQGWDPTLPDNPNPPVIIYGGSGGSGGSGSDSPPCTSNWYKTDNPCNGNGDNMPSPPIITTWIPLNNNQVVSIQNNITNPCLVEVFNIINNDRYKDGIADMLNKLTNDKIVQVVFNESTTMPTGTMPPGVYAYTQGFPSITITFNTSLLSHCSQEYITNTFFHEVIHAYMRAYMASWSISPSAEHNLMIQNYLQELVNTVMQIFPNLTEKNAWCIAFEGLVPDQTDNQMDINYLNMARIAAIQKITELYPSLNSEAAIFAIANSYSETGTQGTRTANCQ